MRGSHSEMGDKKRAGGHRETLKKEGNIYRAHDRARIRYHRDPVHYYRDRNQEVNDQPTSEARTIVEKNAACPDEFCGRRHDHPEARNGIAAGIRLT